jgi:hypothetical protein
MEHYNSQSSYRKILEMPRHRHPKIYNPPQTDPVLEALAEKILDKIPDEVVHSDFDGQTDIKIRKVLKIRTEKLAIGIPMDELMFSQFFSNFMYLSVMPWDVLLTATSTFVTDARNSIHNTFLEQTEATHLFMVDSDVLPPPDTIERLLAHDKPVVGGVYFKKEKFKIRDANGNVSIIQRPTVYDFNRFDEEKQKYFFHERLKVGKGLEKVDGMGAGCWMIRRDVAEAVGKSPFSLDFGGEDLTFCKTIERAGFPIYVDWDLQCAHAGVFFV